MNGLLIILAGVVVVVLLVVAGEVVVDIFDARRQAAVLDRDGHLRDLERLLSEITVAERRMRRLTRNTIAAMVDAALDDELTR